ncbi:MAG: hypothetical protein ACPLW7_03640 [Minisyncoccia bacterium]|jgi:hypothetical protein
MVLKDLFLKLKKYFWNFKLTVPLDLSLFKGVFFTLLFFVYLFSSFIFNFSLGLKIIVSIIILLLWKIIQGLSWLNFYFLLFSIFSLSLLSVWFNKIFILVDLFIFVFFLFKKIIYNQTETNNYLFYFSEFNWTLMSYGLYFYGNQFFSLGLIIYLLGISILSFYLFLIQNKKIQINYWIFILIKVELFLLLSYLSINGFLFSLILTFLGRILLFQL